MYVVINNVDVVPIVCCCCSFFFLQFEKNVNKKNNKYRSKRKTGERERNVYKQLMLFRGLRTAGCMCK